MAKSVDIEKIIEQERVLQFREFDERIAFDIGKAIQARAARETLGLVVDVRTWDRPLFYCALPGTAGENSDWVRRKANTVRRLHKSSYRVALELDLPDRLFPERRVMPQADFAMAGGAFPIRIKGVAGVIGAISVSGLHERDDHNVAVTGVCEVLGIDGTAYDLGPPAAS